MSTKEQWLNCSERGNAGEKKVNDCLSAMNLNYKWLADLKTYFDFAVCNDETKKITTIEVKRQKALCYHQIVLELKLANQNLGWFMKAYQSWYNNADNCELATLYWFNYEDVNYIIRGTDLCEYMKQEQPVEFFIEKNEKADCVRIDVYDLIKFCPVYYYDFETNQLLKY